MSGPLLLRLEAELGDLEMRYYSANHFRHIIGPFIREDPAEYLSTKCGLAK